MRAACAATYRPPLAVCVRGQLVFGEYFLSVFFVLFLLWSPSIIGLLGLSRCCAPALRCAFLASCPRVYTRASLSVRSAIFPSPVPRMPHTHKSRNAPVSCEPRSVLEAAAEEDAGPVEESLAAQHREGGGDAGGGVGGGDDNVGDGEITKSPSDPKQYR